MPKNKVILHLKNGQIENLYPQNDSEYNKLIENLEQDELIHIDKGSGTTKTIRSNNIEWWETETGLIGYKILVIKEIHKERIFTAGGRHYHEKDGKLRFVTEEEFNKLKTRLYR